MGTAGSSQAWEVLREMGPKLCKETSRKYIVSVGMSLPWKGEQCGKNSKDWGKPLKRASKCQSEVREDMGVAMFTSPQRCSWRLEP